MYIYNYIFILMVHIGLLFGLYTVPIVLLLGVFSLLIVLLLEHFQSISPLGQCFL